MVEYQDFKNGMADTYILQPIVFITVVIETTGLMKTNLQKYLRLIPGKVKSLQLQVEVVRETVSMLKRALGYRLAT